MEKIEYLFNLFCHVNPNMADLSRDHNAQAFVLVGVCNGFDADSIFIWINIRLMQTICIN